MSETLQVVICGLPRDHKCDYDGPTLCGGTNEDGTYWQGTCDESNRRRATWGSASCSICGRTAMENSVWMD